MARAKNQLKALIDRVRRGETVLIEDRGIPVAQLQPVSPGLEADQARIGRLVRAGVLRRAPEAPVKDPLRDPPPRLKPGTSGIAALLAERAGR